MRVTAPLFLLVVATFAPVVARTRHSSAVEALPTAAACPSLPDPVVLRVLDLDPSPSHSSIATAVNRHGAVAGYRDIGADMQAFLWTESGGLTFIGPGAALGINSAAIVVGHTPGVAPRPFRWSADDGMVLLPTLGGPSGAATAINDAGDVVGYSQAAGGGAVRATLWKANGRVVDLGNLGGDAVPTRLTNRGIVVGWGRDRSDQIHAFTWTARTGLVDIGAGQAFGVNGRGIATGRTVAALDQALEWPWSASSLTLGPGEGRAINSADVVVGAQRLGDEEDLVAALWAPGVPVRRLGTLGGCTSIALDLNDRGIIVGSSRTASGQEHATLWQVAEANVASFPTLDTLWRPEPPRTLARLVSTTMLTTGSAARINDAGQAMILTSMPPSPLRTLIGSVSDGFTDIGGFSHDPRFVYTRGIALNDRGEIAGLALSAHGFYQPFVWSRSDGLELLSDDPPEQPALDINDAGEVVGGDGSQSAFRWTRGKGLVVVNPLGGRCGSSGRAIDRWGEGVGGSSIAGMPCGEDADPSHAYLQPSTGPARDLGTLGGALSEGVAVNDRGQVAGWSQTVNGQRQAFFWSRATNMVPLGTLGGPSSHPVGINDAGEIVGTSTTSSGYTHGFFWSLRTGMIDIGTGQPSAINNLGHVVGTLTTPTGPAAFFWSEIGERTTLKYSAHALDINNRGQAVGDRLDSSGQMRATSWQIRATVSELLDRYEAEIAVRRYGRVLTSTELADNTRWLGKARESLATGNSTRLTTYLDKLKAALGQP